MSKKVWIITLTLILAIIGVGAGIYLVQQQQDIRDEASVPDGVSEVYLQPATKTANAGETFPVDIYFSTGGETISAMSIQLQYSFTGTQPPLEVSEIIPNSSLLLTGEWSFPVKKIETLGSQIQVRLAAINLSTAGFSSTTDTKIATLNFQANAAGSITMEFDPQQTKITQKSTAADILLTPISTGRYTVAGAPNPTAAPTPTPTTAGTAPTSTPVPGSPTATPTPTPVTETSSSSTGNPTPTPTPADELLVAGAGEVTMTLGLIGLIFLAIGGLLFI